MVKVTHTSDINNIRKHMELGHMFYCTDKKPYIGSLNTVSSAKKISQNLKVIYV